MAQIALGILIGIPIGVGVVIFMQVLFMKTDFPTEEDTPAQYWEKLP